jgi:hypothetical protein
VSSIRQLADASGPLIALVAAFVPRAAETASADRNKAIGEHLIVYELRNMSILDTMSGGLSRGSVAREWDADGHRHHVSSGLRRGSVCQRWPSMPIAAHNDNAGTGGPVIRSGAHWSPKPTVSVQACRSG